MSILVNKNSKVVVQGITGTEGIFHTNQMVEYGTNVVAGVTPGKGGETATDHKIPVFIDKPLTLNFDELCYFESLMSFYFLIPLP